MKIKQHIEGFTADNSLSKKGRKVVNWLAKAKAITGFNVVLTDIMIDRGDVNFWAVFSKEIRFGYVVYLLLHTPNC